MRLFAIGDLHLPGGEEKPMDVFGTQWEHHFERISEDWRSRVAEEDTVLIPGDISWAMQLRAAVPDLEMIGQLPGKKVLLKGNHDYWWNAISQVRAHLPEGMYAIQHDAIETEHAVICGTRGWLLPVGDTALSEDDEKIFHREMMRLRMSMEAAAAMNTGKPMVVMTHFPPLLDTERDTPVTELFARFPVHTVVYGHLHGAGVRAGFNGEWKGIRYRLVSCDALNFQLAEIPITGEEK